MIFSETPAQNQEAGIASILPDPGELGMWHQVDPVLIFAGEDLYKFIDGGADIYFEYGFQQVGSAEYQNSKSISIKLEIYEMTSAPAAYGMYSINAGTQGKTVKVGNEGVLNEYYLVFWKDKYLTFISSDDTTGETLEGILILAESIDKNIYAPGKKPKLCETLPKQNLTANKYIRGLLGLSSIYDFDAKNIFNVQEGVVGMYRNHRTFIFKYDSEKDAERWYRNTSEILKTSSQYSKFQEYTGHYTMSDQKGSQFCVTHLENLIVIVMTDQGSDVSVLCDSVISSIKNSN